MDGAIKYVGTVRENYIEERKFGFSEWSLARIEHLEHRFFSTDAVGANIQVRAGWVRPRGHVLRVHAALHAPSDLKAESCCGAYLDNLNPGCTPIPLLAWRRHTGVPRS